MINRNINPTRVKAIAKKEFIQIIRDPRSLWMAIAIPMLLLIMFGYALTLDVDHVPIVVWDQDGTNISRDLLLDFSNSPYFEIAGYSDNYGDIEKYIDKNKSIAAIIIPRYFSRLLGGREKSPIQFLIDGSDSNTATIALSYAEAIITNYNKKQLIKATEQAGAAYIQPIDMRPRVWFNENLKSRNYIIPGLIAVILMVIASLLTSLTIAREWERGTMEQLISTPVSAQEVLIGKFAPYFVIGFADVLIAVVMGNYIFHVPFRGSLALLFASSCIFLTGALFLGILISIVAKSQVLASQFALITSFLPAFLLSGFAFPISNMPTVIQIITYAIPTRYFVSILKGIYLKGVGIKILLPEIIFLIVFGTIVIVIAHIKFRKRVS